MRRGPKTIIWISILVLVGLIALRTYQAVRARDDAASPVSKGAAGLSVTVQRIGTGTLNNSVNITGEMEALFSVDIVSKVSGRLERLRSADGALLEEGVVLKKGQVMAVIEHGALEAAVQTAKAAVLRANVQAKPEVVAATVQETRAASAAVKAQLAGLSVNLSDLEREKDRMQRLYEQGSCPEQLRDKAMTAYQAAVENKKALEAQLQRAEASVTLAEAQIQELASVGVEQAQAVLNQAEVALSDATIEAPIAGVIGQRFAEEGEMVGPGRPLVRIVQIDTVKAVGSVSERYVGVLVPDKTPVRLSVDAYPGEVFEGVVRLVGVEVDRQTRSVKVEARIPNPQHRLRPGMFARMEVVVGTRENVTVVPDTALLRQGEEVYAFVVNGTRAHRRAVKLGLTEGAMHEVLEGLKSGDAVIVRGQRLVQDGAEVIVVEEGKQ